MSLESPVITYDFRSHGLDRRNIIVIVYGDRNINALIGQIRYINRTRNDDFRRRRLIVILYMPVRVVGVISEHQRKLIMSVPLRIEIVRHVLAKHASVGDIAI